MCRALLYLGNDIALDSLFYLPDNSLIKQSYNPQLMTGLLNLAGFGFAVWNKNSRNPQLPNLYKTCGLPFHDKILRNISVKSTADCMLAHVRGVFYNVSETVSMENVHPFLYQGTNVAFAHNGDLFNHNAIKYDVIKYVKPQFKSQIFGTTDSELMYALFISQLKTAEGHQTIEEIFAALLDTIEILKKVRKKNRIAISSPLNMFISNGRVIVATRYIMDYGHFGMQVVTHEVDTQYNSLWYTFGESYGQQDEQFKMTLCDRNTSIIIASEPLTHDTTTWVEVPEYAFIAAEIENKKIRIQSLDILL